MNSRAVSLTKPAYPQNAKQVNASGQVTVQISVDENGNVTSARALSGHPLLRPAAENAARQSRFNPVKVNDRAVSANGLLVYNFIDQ
jgi:TonB family protein